MLASADSTEQRRHTYRRLVLRNRVVAVLRLALPALGLVVVLVFAVQILMASFGAHFAIGRVSFSGGTVRVDTPSYSGVTATGDVYRIGAEAAETQVGSFNVIRLSHPTLVLTKPNGVVMRAEADAGDFNTIDQVMHITGAARITDSAGNDGTLQQVTVDLPHQRLEAAGPTLITTRDGMTIRANHLDYRALQSLWTFGQSTVTLPMPSDASSGATAK